MFRHEEHFSLDGRPVRSFLYVPADRPDRMQKALTLDVDAVIFDLEDAVAPQSKHQARGALAEVLDRLVPSASGPQIHVRCNREGDGWAAADLDVAVHPMVHTLRLAKAEDPRALSECAAAVGLREDERGMDAGSVGLDPLIESALGVLRSAELIRCDRAHRLCLGGADLARDLGVDRRAARTDPLLNARQTLVLVSRAAGRPGPVDTVCTDIRDTDLVFDEAQQARAQGFTGKSIIHPRQIDPVHRAFHPTAAEFAWAERVAAAWSAATEAGQAAAMVDGEFIDAPVSARAVQILTSSTANSTPAKEVP